MTGFAAQEGSFGDWRWSAELRSVNGKGLDLRLRVPDWIEGFEPQARSKIANVLKRGNVTLSLKVARADSASPIALNPRNLDAVLAGMVEIEAKAQAAGLDLAPVSAADIAVQRGVMEQSSDDAEDTSALKAALLDSIGALALEFDKMRADEGAALREILLGQLNEVVALTETARADAEARKDQVAASLQANLQKIVDANLGVAPERVAQELALLAVKSDVTEELDRLGAHVSAAHSLLDEARGVGRKLDFLMQEFNREANTLCSKSQNADLTRTGLALKALIDQMREQVQNVE